MNIILVLHTRPLSVEEAVPASVGKRFISQAIYYLCLKMLSLIAEIVVIVVAYVGGAAGCTEHCS